MQAARLVRIGLLLLVSISLVACASRPAAPVKGAQASASAKPSVRKRAPPADADGPPARLIDVHAIPEPVPRSEPRARYGNHSPYQVYGRTYHVLPSAEGYVERGIASWYGSKFQGRPTSSMEPYDLYELTAAHRTLPLPAYARVTNLENGASVVVRINDRGPFVGNRLIDLSWAAAVRLGVDRAGTARVEVRTLTGPDGSRSSEPKAEPLVPVYRASAGTPSRLWVQLGAFGDRANARRLAREVENAGVKSVRVERHRDRGRTLHRVRIGPMGDRQQAERVVASLQNLGLGSPRVLSD